MKEHISKHYNSLHTLIIYSSVSPLKKCKTGGSVSPHFITLCGYWKLCAYKSELFWPGIQEISMNNLDCSIQVFNVYETATSGFPADGDFPHSHIRDIGASSIKIDRLSSNSVFRIIKLKLKSSFFGDPNRKVTDVTNAWMRDSLT